MHSSAAPPGATAAEWAALEGVHVAAGRATLVSDVTLRFEPTELVCVLGPNGAGKSTLLSLLNATRRPRAGTVRLFGTEVWRRPERERARLRANIGTVFQRSDYNPQVPLTVREVVLLGRAGRRGLLRPPGAEDLHCADEAIARLGLEPLARREFRSLSGGEQQKTHVARALAQRPHMLLLDEPASGLDVDWQERLVALVDSLSRESGIPIVMTTHHTGHIPVSCGRVVLMLRGRVIFDGPPAAALTPESLSQLYGCPIEVSQHKGRIHCHSAGGITP
jgi:iron complex transport system ATP-binding protein